jgi:hypothetical protein
MGQPSAIIHIGLRKTGSTSLQRALSGGRTRLQSQGCFYPNRHLPNAEQHSHLGLFIREGQYDKFSEAMSGILRDFAESKCDTLILSGEHFSTLEQHLVNRLWRGLSPTFGHIRVRLYVRNLYQYILSITAHLSKNRNGCGHPLEAIRRMRRFSPTQVLDRWEAVAGRDAVTVGCLDALPNGDVVADFAEFADVELPKTYQAGISDKRSNTSTDPITSGLLSGLVVEFGLRAEDFYSAYTAESDRRISLPAIESRYYDLVEEWVQNVDISHAKLAPYCSLLREKPSVSGREESTTDQLAEYLAFLATVLLRTRREALRRKDRAVNNDGQHVDSGNRDAQERSSIPAVSRAPDLGVPLYAEPIKEPQIKDLRRNKGITLRARTQD